MKYFFITVVLLFFNFNFTTFSQTENKVQTLLGNEDIRNGGYIAPEIKVSQIKGTTGIILGGRLGWVINGVISVGGAGYGIVTSHNNEGYYSLYSDTLPNIDKYDTTIKMTGGWGGLFIEYIYLSNNMLHFTADLVLGIGGVSNSIIKKDIFFDSKDEKTMTIETSSFFIIEPRVAAELNIFKFLRVNAGISYRYTGGIEINNVNDSDLSGICAGVCLKFGFF